MMRFEELVKKWFKINSFLMFFDDDFSKICDEEKPFVQPWNANALMGCLNLALTVDKTEIQIVLAVIQDFIWS